MQKTKTGAYNQTKMKNLNVLCTELAMQLAIK
jgi:hypothetical protein